MNDLHSMDWPEVLDNISNFATSHLAKNLLKNTQPFKTEEAAKESFAQVKEAQNLLTSGPRPFFESLDLYSTWHQRLEHNAVLKMMELKDIRSFCYEVIALNELIQNSRGPWVSKIKTQLIDGSEPLSAIDHVISADGSIKIDASELLYKLFREKNDLSNRVQKSLDRIVKTHQMEPILQDKYVTTREGRWVLPIKSGMQHSFGGIIHGASQSKQTVFMEPNDVVPLNNRIRQVENEIEEEIERILYSLSSYLYGQLDKFRSSKAIVLECDCVLAKAQFSSLIGGQPCEFSPDTCELNDLFHPLLKFNGDKPVPNSLRLSQDKSVLLLSGPNAGGKTVLLKAFGLAAQMARCGLPIPASSSSKIPFFKNIILSLGDNQDVGEHLSTFAAHLKTLNQALSAEGPSDLILIDEICSSTDPEEGAALARSFINHYATKNVFAVITSHFGGLKKAWPIDGSVINGSLEYSTESGPTYQFLLGVPGQSLAIQMARRVGVSSHIIKNAIDTLSPEHKKYQNDLQSLEALKGQLVQSNKDLKGLRQEALIEKERYQKLIENFEKDRNQMLSQSMERAEQKVEKLISHAKADQIFRRHEDLQQIKSKLPEIIKVKPQKDIPQILDARSFIKRFPPGSMVFVTSINRDGVIQGTPNSKGEVPILSNSMRLSIHWKKLGPSKLAHNPTKEILRKTSKFSVAPIDNDRIIDLRGHSVEEAISEIEIHLDAASLNQEDRVKVIHGHGTEILKRSVRTYLSRCIYVQKWQAGTSETGGDGITWVEIKDTQS